ncbi:hypothetical protein [Sulfurimonas sp.]|uniref:hypothetical protein n=1 Tax=Sulfurimonas sp. TaxID=2022749 RepID=UPI0035688B07
MRLIKITTMVLLLLTSSLFSNSDDKYIKDALLKYNFGIIKMTKSGDSTLLKDMLSKDVFLKLMVWADSWKFSNLAMVARINDLRFSPIAYNENNATIKTMENWTFAYANLNTRDFALKPITIFYKMHYTLQKDGDIWKIIAIKHLQEEIFEDQNLHKPEPKQKNIENEIIKDAPQAKIATH